MKMTAKGQEDKAPLLSHPPSYLKPLPIKSLSVEILIK